MLCIIGFVVNRLLEQFDSLIDWLMIDKGSLKHRRTSHYMINGTSSICLQAWLLFYQTSWRPVVLYDDVFISSSSFDPADAPVSVSLISSTLLKLCSDSVHLEGGCMADKVMMVQQWSSLTSHSRRRRRSGHDRRMVQQIEAAAAAAARWAVTYKVYRSGGSRLLHLHASAAATARADAEPKISTQR